MNERPQRILIGIAIGILAVSITVLLANNIFPFFLPEEAEPTTEPTTAPTTEPTTEPTDPPPPDEFLLAFVGNCALQAPANSSFYTDNGEDFAFPLQNARELFENDSCTFVNLESILSDGAFTQNAPLRVPTAYGQILSLGNVDFVCLANEDAALLGQQGLDDTAAALDKLGIGHVGNHKTALFTTEDGLVIGIYAETAPQSAEDYADIFASLRGSGAELIVAMFHWGEEYDYLPDTQQESLAHAAIDAGADIVYGHHPKVLQPVESYKNGIILYSTGTFLSPEAQPAERDTAVMHVQVVRHADGTVSLGSTAGEPWLISGDSPKEAFQPRPVDQKLEKEIVERIWQKQAGTYPESKLTIGQTPTLPTEGTVPDSSAPTEGTTPTTEPSAPSATEPEESTTAPSEEAPDPGETPPAPGGTE